MPAVTPHQIPAAAQFATQAQIDLVRTAIREEYEQSKNYTNVITGIGYAGFFALWALTKDMGYTRIHALAGLCTGISLIFFVSWELYQTAVKGHVMQKVSVLLSLNDPSTQFVYQQEMAKLVARLARYWPWAFYPSVVFGLTGAGILMTALLLRSLKDLFG
jgi:hypothetical protein